MAVPGGSGVKGFSGRFMPPVAGKPAQCGRAFLFFIRPASGCPVPRQRKARRLGGRTKAGDMQAGGQ